MTLEEDARRSSAPGPLHQPIERSLTALIFPHSDSTWPRSREVIARDFARVPPDELERITARNCAALYGLAAAR